MHMLRRRVMAVVASSHPCSNDCHAIYPLNHRVHPCPTWSGCGTYICSKKHARANIPKQFSAAALAKNLCFNSWGLCVWGGCVEIWCGLFERARERLRYICVQCLHTLAFASRLLPTFSPQMIPSQGSVWTRHSPPCLKQKKHSMRFSWG